MCMLFGPYQLVLLQFTVTLLTAGFESHSCKDCLFFYLIQVPFMSYSPGAFSIYRIISNIGAPKNNSSAGGRLKLKTIKLHWGLNDA